MGASVTGHPSPLLRDGQLSACGWGCARTSTPTASSAAPYTITTGRDDNGDGVSNDRPAGVGRNSARGASRYDLNTRLTRAFGFGGQRGRASGGGGQQIGRGGAARRRAGRWPGPWWEATAPTSASASSSTSRRSNVLNRTNYVNFSGNLQSPFFGLPTSAAQARRIEVGMQFRF